MSSAEDPYTVRSHYHGHTQEFENKRLQIEAIEVTQGTTTGHSGSADKGNDDNQFPSTVLGTADNNIETETQESNDECQ